MRALLLCSALSLGLAFTSVATAQDYEAMSAGMEQAMADAQASARRPGDEALTCEQLEGEVVITMQDPQVQTVIASQGAYGQQQLDRMNEARGQQRVGMATSLFMGVASAFIPGAGYAAMAQQQMQAAQMQRQSQANMAQMMEMAQQMQTIMPQLMRGQRLYELGQAQSCSFTQQQQAPQ